MSSDETYDEKTGQISSLLSIRDLPAWAAIMIAFGVAAVGSCVLLMIICIVCKASTGDRANDFKGKAKNLSANILL